MSQRDVAQILCPSCGMTFALAEVDYDGEVTCPRCGSILYVVITGGEVESVEVLEEGLEEEYWLEDEDLWETEEEERFPEVLEEEDWESIEE
ncbi:MAG: hypothetical protein DRO06_00720 [Thermoproteota archaeon]|nr:MAG: hypothetical protein DRO06_00720 [Candidatus Korarchaeota archaeon]